MIIIVLNVDEVQSIVGLQFKNSKKATIQGKCSSQMYIIQNKKKN